MNTMLDWATRYHNEGLDVIPVKPREKAVALREWTEYQTRCSTQAEITSWWTHTPAANIGIVSGVNGFVMIDLDHDTGIYDTMRAKFPSLFSGRIERSGSGNGYHIPMFLAYLPDLGYDTGKDRPKGNKTWHTKTGDINVRSRWCQAVVPPSVHPSGGVYRFIQQGDIVRAPDLASVIAWLNQIDPAARIVTARPKPKSSTHDDAHLPIKNFFPSVIAAFASLGYSDVQRDANGETRLPGHGGLLVDKDDKRWYCFSDEMGGDVVDAFGWARFGAQWDRYNRQMFSAVMREMESAAGVGVTRTIAQVNQVGRASSSVWGKQLKSNYWSKS